MNLSSMDQTAPSTTYNRAPFFSDVAKAREANAKSLAAKRAKKEAEKQRLSAVDSLLASQAAREAAAIVEARPGYVGERLKRVRSHIERLDSLIDEEDDPQALDRLASAAAKLSELERQLSGRPLPVLLRPKAEKERKGPTIEPV